MTKIDILEVDGFRILHIRSKPQRLEAKVIFDRDNISQKFIFKLMELTHEHGFGCSPPNFNGPYDPNMSFLVGTVIPSARSLNRNIDRLCDCLVDISEFSEDFAQQLDFSQLDLTMFNGVDLRNFIPTQLAAIRDQHYNGSWEDFFKAMNNENRLDEAEAVEKCISFEKINNKDIGLVGHKLGMILNLLIDYSPAAEVN